MQIETLQRKPAIGMDALSLLVLCSLTALFYGSTLGMFFFGDEACDITRFATYREHYYIGEGHRPFEFLLFDFLLSTFGLNPLPYRLLVLILHVANSMLVFYAVGRLTKRKETGLIASILFLTYWPNSEAVAWFSVIHEVLGAFFSFLAIIYFWKFRAEQRSRYYVMALVSYVLAVSSKETTIILPLIILLTDLYGEGVFTLQDLTEKLKKWKRWILPHIPFFTITIVTVYLLMHTDSFKVAASGGGPSFGWERISYELYQNIGYLFSFPPGFHGAVSGYLILTIVLVNILINPYIKNKRTIIFLAVCIVISLAPYLIVRIGLRHLYFPSAASMAILAIILVEGLSFRYMIKTGRVLLTVFISLLVLINYLCVKEALEYYHHNAKIYRSFYNLIDSASADNSKIFCINFPRTIDPSALVNRVNLFNPNWTPMPGNLNIYPEYLLLPIDLPKGLNDRRQSGYSLYTGYQLYPEVMEGRPCNYYNILAFNQTLGKVEEIIVVDGARKIMPEDFDKLSQQENCRLFIFNPVLRIVEEVTGMSYKDLIEKFL